MIRTVLFDLDGTLYDRDEHIASLARSQFETFRSALPGVDADHFVAKTIELDVHGHGRPPDLHSVLLQSLGFSADLAQKLEKYFRDNFHSNLVLPDDTAYTLKTLRDRGKQLGIITNGPTEWQSRKLDALGIRHFFDVIVISGEEGIDKPDTEIFRRALERCRAKAPESVFIGDHPDVDVQGAMTAGMKAIWKRMPYWKAPADVPSVARLSEILPYCE